MRMPTSIRDVLHPEPAKVFSLAIFAAGYEARATHIAKHVKHTAANSIAIGFSDKHSICFSENVSWFQKSGCEVEILCDDEFEPWLNKRLKSLELAVTTPISIGVDISCFNRYRLASIINAIRNINSPYPVETVFWYSLAEFSAPPTTFAPNSHLGPVHPSFSGWFLRPELPPVAIVGLGYEQDKALGAVEHIEAISAWAFIPRSPISQYLKHLYKANETLLESIPPERQIEYDIGFPRVCTAMLQSLAAGLANDNNVVLLPFGPKLFALCCLLVASSDDRLAVWRVSSLENEDETNRVGSSNIFGLASSWTNVKS